MRITFEGSMEEIEVMALTVAAGCRALRGGGEKTRGAGNPAAGRADGAPSGAEELYRILDMSQDEESAGRVIGEARTFGEAVNRAVSYEDEHAGEGVTVSIIRREREGVWTQVWPGCD